MSPAKSDYALGVDIGGTFTDLVLLDRATGKLSAGKVLTDYDDLAAAVRRGVDELLAAGGIPGGAVRGVIHGTTLVTNALIQRRGAPTALIVTRGFRDVLEFGRESRYDVFQLDIDLPPPLLARELIFEADERIDASGAIVTRLDEAGTRDLALDLRARGIRSAGVCLLHAYQYDAHEKRIKAIFAEHAPEIAISLSSEVMPDIREFERASTVAANAYVQPAIMGYLERLASLLRELKIRSDLLLMTSDGGTISVETAVKHPVRLVESGPAGGVMASAHLARSAGLDKLLAYDMGGTTAKICLIEDGRPERSDEIEYGRVYRFMKGSGLPLKVPSVDMIEIGAGGGSIAHLDRVGRLRVGPESAGASPGPAAYGLGGTEPTVTDADLFLGYIAADSFLGGKMRLDKSATDAAIGKLAGELKVTPTRAAWGIHEVVNDNMARAAKIHALERGSDPREYTLVAYGGAGPVHAYGIARALGIKRIVYPMRAGVMSAFGFLVAPPAFELVRGMLVALSSIDAAELSKTLRAMEQEGRALVRTAGIAAKDCIARRELAVRFNGQSSQLNVELPAGTLAKGDLEALRERFIKLYRDRYHRLNPEVPLEVVSARVVVSGRERNVKVARPRASGQSAANAKKGTRAIYLHERDRFVPCPVYDRYRLAPNARIKGPASIEEVESTVLLGAEYSAVVDRHGNLVAVRR